MARTSKTPTKKCISCNVDRAIKYNFYATESKLFPDGKVPICKKCVKEQVDENDIDSVKKFLRQIDKPFIWEIWRKAYESENETIGWYLREINSMPYYKGLGFDDSREKPEEQEFYMVGKESDSIDSTNKMTTDSGNTIELDADIMIKWGGGYSAREYLDMEKMYQDMMVSNDISTPQHKLQLELYCKLAIEMKRALKDKDYEGFSKITTQFNNVLKNSGFRPIDRVSGADSAGVRSFAQIFEEVEKDGYIEPKPVTEKQDIVDKTIMYLANYWRKLVQVSELRTPPSDTPKVNEHGEAVMDDGN